MAKRVAAYCRVSKVDLLHSFDTQVKYYSERIQENPNWEFAGIYSDEAISGTRISLREGFKQLLADCDEGKIDLILTKSVSRFARNTLDTLKTTRYLRSKGVEVYFEEQNISTFSPEGELMLTIIAAIAQEEVVSTSENIKWARRKGFKKGDPQVHFRVFGYEWKEGVLTIVPEQAEAVRVSIRGRFSD
ncbi:MAG: recombinase family protein [Lachnospiraceae bacterium]|nr:recombinase family protein [Lachnospiraceae bacterium]